MPRLRFSAWEDENRCCPKSQCSTYKKHIPRKVILSPLLSAGEGQIIKCIRLTCLEPAMPTTGEETSKLELFQAELKKHWVLYQTKSPVVQNGPVLKEKIPFLIIKRAVCFLVFYLTPHYHKHAELIAVTTLKHQQVPLFLDFALLWLYQAAQWH